MLAYQFLFVAQYVTDEIPDGGHFYNSGKYWI